MKLKTEAKKADNITKAEYEVMKVLWERGEVSAGQLYRILQDKIGWKKSTSYTVLGKCIEKGFVGRTEPDYICHALLSREDVCASKIAEFTDLYFGGSKKQLLYTFLRNSNLTSEEIQTVKDILGRYIDEN